MYWWSETVQPDCMLAVSAREHMVVITHASLPDPSRAAELIVRNKNTVACALTKANPQRRLELLVRKGTALSLDARGGAITLCGWSVKPDTAPKSEKKPAAGAKAPAKTPAPVPAPATAPAAAKASRLLKPTAEPARTARAVLAPFVTSWDPAKGSQQFTPDPQLRPWQRGQDRQLDSDDEEKEVEARPVVIGGKDYYLNANTYRVYQGGADAAEAVGYYHPDTKKVLPHPPVFAKPTGGAGAQAHRARLQAAAKRPSAGAKKRKAEEEDSDAVIDSEEEEDDLEDVTPGKSGQSNVVPQDLMPSFSEKLRRRRKKQRISKLREEGMRPGALLVA